jgi:hypothetical protein
MTEEERIGGGCAEFVAGVTTAVRSRRNLLTQLEEVHVC